MTKNELQLKEEEVAQLKERIALMELEKENSAVKMNGADETSETRSGNSAAAKKNQNAKATGIYNVTMLDGPKLEALNVSHGKKRKKSMKLG